MTRMAAQDMPVLPDVRPGNAKGAARRRDPHGRLLRCLLRIAGPTAQIEMATSEPWASVTFQGSRHQVELLFIGETAHADSTAMAEKAPEAEFSIPGHIVAAVEVEGQHQDRDGAGRPFALLRLSALVIEDW